MKPKFTFPISFVLSFLSVGICFGQETELTELDKDTDGKVTVQEFKDYASEKLQGFDKLEKFANAVDADSNGTISEDEFNGRMQVLQTVMNGTEEPKNNSSKKTKKDKASSDATKTFNKIKKLVAKDKWSEAAKLMTKKAQDELAVEQVISAIGLTNMDMQIPIPDLEDAIDELENVVVKHGLDKLEIDSSKMFRMSVNMDGEEEDESDSSEEDLDENATQGMATQSDKILKHLGDSGKRWDVIKDLWNAKKTSPFSMSHFNGKVESEESKDDVTFLKVKMSPAESDDGGGVVIQMVSPPVVLRMVKTDDSWKLDGRDHEKTMKLMKEFMENQPGGGAMPAPRKDF